MLSDRIKRIVIAGVGLIGGSFGMALKKAGFHGEIVGLVRRESAIKEIEDAGAVDLGTLDYGEALADADLIVIATPVDKIAETAEKTIKYAPDGCIFTDVGSTKREIINKVEGFMPKNLHFVGSHPMAGSHKTGVSSAKASLFRDNICIITPTKSSNQEVVDLVKQIWEMVGAQVKFLSPEEHDRLVGATSHLPHVAASALAQIIGEIESNGKEAIDYIGSGAKGIIRLALGSIEMWEGIFLQNADNLSSMIDMLEKELAEIRKILDSRDAKKLLEKLEKAQRIKNSIQELPRIE